jgi:chromosome segregation ATPase
MGKVKVLVEALERERGDEVRSGENEKVRSADDNRTSKRRGRKISRIVMDNPELAKEFKNIKKAIVSLRSRLEEKQVLLEEITNTIDSLRSISENLSRRLAILSRQAGLLELRSTPEGAAPEISLEKRCEISQQLSLTRAEEEEFKKKRKELKNLIKRLWDLPHMQGATDECTPKKVIPAGNNDVKTASAKYDRIKRAYADGDSIEEISAREKLKPGFIKIIATRYNPYLT